MIVGLMAAWLPVSAAWAAAPVVHDRGDPTDAVTVAAARTGLPAAQLRAVDLETLMKGRPVAIGGATLRHCAGEPAMLQEIKAAAVRAEGAWRAGDPTGAMDHLDLGMARLGCLSERVDGQVAARMFLLRGALLARSGAVEPGRAEVQTALSFQPELGWDEWLPSEGRALLSTLKTDAARATLELAPAATATGPWIDGTGPGDGGAAMGLRPGLHLVQVASTSGFRSAWLTLSGDGALVVPSAYKRPVLSRMADPSQRASVERLLQASFPDAGAAYVVADGGIWMTTLGATAPETDTLTPPPPPAPEAPEPRKRRR